MIAFGIALALAAAVIHGSWNVLVKSAGDPIATFRRATLLAAGVATVALVPEWILLGRPAFNPVALGLGVVSATLETIYLLLLSTAYRRGDLSAVYPIARGTAPLLAVAVGLVVLGESLSTAQLAGVGLLLLGIVAVTLSQSGGGATVPALLTGLCIAAYTSVDRVGVRLAAPWLYAWLLFTLMAIEMPLGLWIASRWAGMAAAGTQTWGKAALVGGGMWAGYFLVLWALSFAPLAIVAPVREVSIVAVAAWGVWRMQERSGVAMKLSGAAAAVIGVALLAA
ncbi:MAG TPA: EamA family transporter [Candidatus Dormibacteraeota bacterium]|nr:EamA family transporter [Candidatus Dormibacteraeota bacterium]